MMSRDMKPHIDQGVVDDMKPHIDQQVTIRYRPGEDTEVVTVTGKLVGIEYDKHIAVRISARKVRYVQAGWVVDWSPVNGDTPSKTR